MKIIDTSTYEKLKIRPVNVSDLHESGLICVSADKLSISDLRPGFACKTTDNEENEPDIFIYLNVERVRKLFPTYPEKFDALVRPRKSVYYGYRGTYLGIYSYEGSWPKHPRFNELDIVCVYEIMEEPDINSFDELVEFYNKYNLFDL